MLFHLQDAKGWIYGQAPSSSSAEEYVGKGFPKEMVLNAIKANGNNNAINIISLYCFVFAPFVSTDASTLRKQ